MAVLATTQCEHVYFLGSYSNPPEQCDEDAVEGSEYCSRHQEEDPWGDEPEWDCWDER